MEKIKTNNSYQNFQRAFITIVCSVICEKLYMQLKETYLRQLIILKTGSQGK